MTNPKTPESRAVASRSRPAAPESTSDSPRTTDSGHGDQNAALEQLVALTRSISALVQQNTGSDNGQATATTDRDVDERTRVLFAYDFLGVVLGRRAPSVFQLKTVTVTRSSHTLTFTNLNGATAAKVRAANNRVQRLEGLVEGRPVTIDEGPNAIDDNQRIDSIVTFTVLGGVPVAIGPCLSLGIIF